MFPVSPYTVLTSKSLILQMQETFLAPGLGICVVMYTFLQCPLCYVCTYTVNLSKQENVEHKPLETSTPTDIALDMDIVLQWTGP